MHDDPCDLDRFLQAQERQYEAALDELRHGRKLSHWIWFIFPQLRALGQSSTARLYGLQDLDEATAYWQHPRLGARLRECLGAMLRIEKRSATDILGDIDALKLRSCLTLFRAAAPGDEQLQAALLRFYAGQADDLTLSLLRDDSQ
jgi:uncharacterized protein (DUF1810 family)